MALIETDSGTQQLAGQRSRRGPSPAQRGEGRTPTLAAARSLRARMRALTHNVWAPVLAKGLGLLAGMIALAAIGASSLARGSGVPVAPAVTGPRAPGTAVAALGVPLLGPGGAEANALEAPPAHTEPGDAGTAPNATTAEGKIVLNLANADELRHLPGIGPKRADAIVALRAKLGGRFKRLSDLLRVKGIGPKGLKKLEPRVVLDLPKPS